MDSLNTLKAIYLLLIFVVCFLGSLIPIRLSSIFKNNRFVLSYANCLGGGVLLGAAFIHLLSDSEHASVMVMEGS